MQNFVHLSEGYLDYCQYQKRLDSKTLKAYRIDIAQLLQYIKGSDGCLSKINLSNYVISLHNIFKPKTVKRKIASIKAFCNWMEYEEFIASNPFSKMNLKFHEPHILPKTIPLDVIKTLLQSAYQEYEMNHKSPYKMATCLRNIAVLELLFATGMRVSELCSLQSDNLNLPDKQIRIYGKGSKERMITISNSDVLSALHRYKLAYSEQIENVGFLFVNRLNHRLSEQSVRFMIKKLALKAKVQQHLTPHMFRHSFATLLLEEDVDIRYIQQILGHSSITTSQIYTHVSTKKQNDILSLKHPRNRVSINS
ncbi:tyrosine-type recombinase/integrase [Paenibacillus sp. FSL R7-0204]|uniref:tyrosine-type recombinase/integrase n=1 Tax=Paenibacillus sp. FSL R7-0204 TaxID=2921675 RepID=UPI0030F833C0